MAHLRTCGESNRSHHEKSPVPFLKGMLDVDLTMLNIRDLRIAPGSLGDKKLLVDITPAFEYKDGKRMGNLIGYRYTIALPNHHLEKISVRIDGKHLIEKAEGLRSKRQTLCLRLPKPFHDGKTGHETVHRQGH